MDIYEIYQILNRTYAEVMLSCIVNAADSSADIICCFATAKLANFHEVVKPQFRRGG